MAQTANSGFPPQPVHEQTTFLCPEYSANTWIKHTHILQSMNGEYTSRKRAKFKEYFWGVHSPTSCTLNSCYGQQQSTQAYSNKAANNGFSPPSFKPNLYPAGISKPDLNQANGASPVYTSCSTRLVFQ